MNKIAAALVAVFLCAGEAAAQQPCAPLAEMVKALTAAPVSEKPMLELRGKNQIFIIFTNAATGTWTVIGFNPSGQGVACIMAGGLSFGPPSIPGKPI